MNDPPTKLGRLLAGPHNTRLGPAVHAFNLPAESNVCVGSTPTCSTACYAKGFLFRLQCRRHDRNLELSRDHRFVKAMSSEIRRGLIRVVQIHVSGDFYDASYVRKWAEVAQANSQTVFFTSTRSWRIEAVFNELIALARWPNVALWFSEDRDSGRPPPVSRVRRAY